MFLHITFTDGSNPMFYRKISGEKDLKKKLSLWSKNFDLKPITTTKNGGFFFSATPK